MRAWPRLAIVVSLISFGCSESTPRPSAAEPGAHALEQAVRSGALRCPEGTTPVADGDELRCDGPDGQPSGVFLSVDPSGVTRLEGTYSEGVRHGPFVTRWEDGSLQLEGEYRGGEPGGSSTLHLPDGTPWIVRTGDGPPKILPSARADAAAAVLASRPALNALRVEKPEGVLSQDALSNAAALLEEARRAGRGRVIVRHRLGFVPEGLLHASGVQRQRAGIRAQQQRLRGRMLALAARSLADFETVPYSAWEVDESALAELVLDPEVIAIEEDVAVPPDLSGSTPLIGATDVWAEGFTGAGNAVAVLDTGVELAHSFFTGKIISQACYSSNLCPGGASSSTSAGSGADCDGSISGCGHGTHVAGIAVGQGTTYHGVARGAPLIAIKVFSRFDAAADCSPSAAPCVKAYTTDVVRGLERVYALRTSFTIASANLSLGGGQYSAHCDSDSRKSIIDNLRAANIATTIASGNNGWDGSISAPACISSSIAVGSTTKSDVISDFSNHASLVRLLAPGSSITASVIGNTFGSKSGTSMAAPHVAGAWSVIRHARPTWNVNDVLGNLESSGLSLSRGGVSKPRIRLAHALAITAVQPPVFTPSGRTFETSQSVSISSPTSGVTVRYTTNGTNPSRTNGTLISNGASVNLTSTVNLRAIAYRDGWTDSTVTSANYTRIGSITVNLTPSAAVTAGARWRLQGPLSEGFEIGSFARLPFTSGGGSSWSVDTSTAASGAYSARAPTLGHSQAAHLVLAFESAGGNVSFSRRVSSETNWDFLEFYVDDQLRERWSGEVAWSQVSYAVAAGRRTLRWTYTKDASVNSGSDTAWIDDLVIPGDEWRTSGSKLRWVPDGSHTVTFLNLPDWDRPADQTATVSGGSDPVLSAAYVAQPGSLRVEIVPEEARAAGAQWRVSGGAWQVSGAQLPLAPGSYTVQFSTAAGWTAPGSLSVSIQSNVVTHREATYVQDQVVAPSFSPMGGIYFSPVSLTLWTTTPSSSIRYTLDGSVPDETSALYGAALLLPEGSAQTVRARAFRSGWAPSAVAEQHYDVRGIVATPEFSPPGGLFTAAQTVTVSSATPGSTIHLTFDGSVPTMESELYTGPFVIPEETSRTVRARAFRDGWWDSEIENAFFQITGTVQAPVLFPAPGTYTSAQVVNLHSNVPEATVRYTLDGTDPTPASPEWAGPLVVPLQSSAFIRARAFLPGWAPSEIVGGEYRVTGTVAAPGFGVAPGLYVAPQSVTLGTSTPGAAVRYTLDDSPVSASSPLYEEPLTVALDSTVVIRARAYLTEWIPSDEVRGVFRVTGRAPPPTASPAPGHYTSAQAVTLVPNQPGDVIRFTVDGSEPHAGSAVHAGPIAIPLHTSTTLRARSFRPDYEPSEVLVASYTVTGPVAPPTFSPDGGQFVAPQQVAILTSTEASHVRYTLDGSEPSSSSPLYEGPFLLGAHTSTTVRARAFRAGWADSAVSSASFVVTGPVETPTFDLPPGLYTSAQSVLAGSATPGAEVRYTLDGTEPHAGSPAMSQRLALPEHSTTTIRVRAFRSGWAPSEIAEAMYRVTGAVATPVFSPAGGHFTASPQVGLATASPGATIRFTLDGSVPGLSSAEYTGPFEVPLHTTWTVRARAFRPEWADSAVAEAVFVVTGPVQAPEFSLASGLFTEAQEVFVSSDTPGATVRCAFGGASPDESSAECPEPLQLPLDSTVTVRARAFRPGWAPSEITEATYRVTGTVATPVFDPEGGHFTSSPWIALATTTPGATLRFTLDGSEPGFDSAEYTAPFELPLHSTSIVRARAFRPEWADSAIAEAVYVVTGPVHAPHFSLEPGLYTEAQSVFVATETPGASVRCAFGGATPDESSAECPEPLLIPLDSTLTVRARAYRPGWGPSEVVEATYRVTGTVAAPSIAPAGGLFFDPVDVLITCAIPEATVRYTLDGSEPTPLSSVYEGPFRLDLDRVVVVRARAYRPEWVPSEERAETFELTGEVAPPSFSVPPGLYVEALHVGAATTTPQAIVRYTLDGSEPTEASPALSFDLEVPLDSARHVRVRAFRPRWRPSATVDGAFRVTGTVAAPQFGLAEGVYTTPQVLVMTSATAQATIRYTLDGSHPGPDAPVYTGPLTVPLDTAWRVRARAYRPEWAESALSAATFRVTGTVATPSITPEGGVFTTATEVTLATSTASAELRYTVDGSEPHAGSALYHEPLRLGLDSQAQLRVRAFREDWTGSAVAGADFLVTGTVDAPSVNLRSGVYDQPLELVLSSVDAKATIRYTLDGSAPTEKSAPVAGPIELPFGSDVVLRARAYRDQWIASAEVQEHYRVHLPLTVSASGQPLPVGLVVPVGGTFSFSVSGGSGAYALHVLRRGALLDGALSGGGGEYAFTAHPFGPFAGDHEVVVRDTVTGWIARFSLLVPLRVTSSASELLGGQDSGQITVAGAAGGTSVSLEVVSAQTGQPVSGVASLPSAAYATTRPEQGNPATAVLLAGKPAQTTEIRVRARAGGVESVSEPIRVLASVVLQGEVVNAAGWPVAGAEVSLTAEGTTRTSTTGADGGFLLRVPRDLPGAQTLVARRNRFTPSVVPASSCVGSGCRVVLLGEIARLSGTVRGLLGGEVAELVVHYARPNGATEGVEPVSVTGAGAGHDPFEITLDAAVRYARIDASAAGYQPASADPGAEGYDLLLGDFGGVNIELEPTTPEVWTGEARPEENRVLLTARVHTGGRAIDVYFVSEGDSERKVIAGPARLDGSPLEQWAAVPVETVCGGELRYRAIAVNDRQREAIGAQRLLTSTPCTEEPEPDPDDPKPGDDPEPPRGGPDTSRPRGLFGCASGGTAPWGLLLALGWAFGRRRRPAVGRP